jgi:hypothetical protein
MLTVISGIRTLPVVFMMAGLVPTIYVIPIKQDADIRHKAGDASATNGYPHITS